MKGATTTTAKTAASFYQRKLPDTCTAFASKAGKKIFSSALANNGLRSFFPLIQQFTTQSEPAFCGLSTLVLVLNALSVDPQQQWKGPWRWYEEKMLNCCLDLEDVKKTGITLKDFQCLAHCQGLSVEMKHCNEKSTIDDFRAAVQRACVDSEEDMNDDDDEAGTEVACPGGVLVVSYSRKIMGQTGSGHFSPIAAYDSASDSVLILDTARFKYGAHWAKLPLVYDAMKPIDPDTGKSRGYALLSFQPPSKSDEELLQPVSMVFRSKMSQRARRKKYKDYLQSLENEATWEQVLKFWTDDEADSLCVWEILEPLRLPSDEAEKQTVQKLRELIKCNLKLLGSESNCCDSHGHKTCLGSFDALFVIYLASLSVESRTKFIMSSDGGGVSDLTKQQLLNEAELIATAIETSDQMSL